VDLIQALQHASGNQWANVAACVAAARRELVVCAFDPHDDIRAIIGALIHAAEIQNLDILLTQPLLMHDQVLSPPVNYTGLLDTADVARIRTCLQTHHDNRADLRPIILQLLADVFTAGFPGRYELADGTEPYALLAHTQCDTTLYTRVLTAGSSHAAVLAALGDYRHILYLVSFVSAAADVCITPSHAAEREHRANVVLWFDHDRVGMHARPAGVRLSTLASNVLDLIVVAMTHTVHTFQPYGVSSLAATSKSIIS
jgi:hypothetical protein